MSVTLSLPRLLRMLILAGAVTLVSACVEVGPDYVRPAANVPATWKEATAPAASPLATLPTHAPWWAIYHDPGLDALVSKVALDNQSLKAAAAHVREARALLAATRGERLPAVSIGTVKTGVRNENDFGLGVSWEIDLWGRIRRDIEAHGAATQASADKLAAATLSIQAALVQGYFALREKDAVIGLLRHAVDGDARWLKIVRNQQAQGVASHGDVTQAYARLGVTQAQLASARVARATLEHAIAVMLGQPPADFSIAAAPFDARVPAVPAGLPSQLLQRRPDIAAAERQVASASARIGVRVAQTYPSITLGAGVGVRKGWFASADVKAPLYAGGSLNANVRHARAAYDAAVADYRQTVLDAFREVEDNLAAQNILAQAAAAQAAAVHSAQGSAKIADDQFVAGIAGYQNVVEARTAALNSGQAALELRLQRLDASVNLIKALGGGWRVGTGKRSAARD